MSGAAAKKKPRGGVAAGKGKQAIIQDDESDAQAVKLAEQHTRDGSSSAQGESSPEYNKNSHNEVLTDQQEHQDNEFMNENNQEGDGNKDNHPEEEQQHQQQDQGEEYRDQEEHNDDNQQQDHQEEQLEQSPEEPPSIEQQFAEYKAEAEKHQREQAETVEALKKQLEDKNIEIAALTKELSVYRILSHAPIKSTASSASLLATKQTVQSKSDPFWVGTSNPRENAKNLPKKADLQGIFHQDTFWLVQSEKGETKQQILSEQQEAARQINQDLNEYQQQYQLALSKRSSVQRNNLKSYANNNNHNVLVTLPNSIPGSNNNNNISSNAYNIYNSMNPINQGISSSNAGNNNMQQNRILITTNNSNMNNNGNNYTTSGINTYQLPLPGKPMNNYYSHGNNPSNEQSQQQQYNDYRKNNNNMSPILKGINGSQQQLQLSQDLHYQQYQQQHFSVPQQQLQQQQQQYIQSNQYQYQQQLQQQQAPVSNRKGQSRSISNSQLSQIKLAPINETPQPNRRKNNNS